VKILAVEFNDDFISVSYVQDPAFLYNSPDSVVTRVVTVTVAAAEAADFLPEFLEDIEQLMDHVNSAGSYTLEQVEASDRDDDDNDSMEIL
jgi:hypothetical protein